MMMFMLLLNAWYFLYWGLIYFLKTDLNEMLTVSVPTEYSYCLLDCSGFGNHSQEANTNITLNLMSLLKNVIALTFNDYQIIENSRTPITHLDVHGS